MIKFDLERALGGARVFDLHEQEVFELKVVPVDKHCYKLTGVSAGVENTYGDHELQMLSEPEKHEGHGLCE